jgi:cytochrome c peroxidase
MGSLTSRSLRRFQRVLAGTAAAIFITYGIYAVGAPHINKFVHSEDESGTLGNYSVVGKIDFQNEDFFTAFGTPGNRRTCASCHLPDQGWTITPEGVQMRFNQTVSASGCNLGTIDAIFALTDGSNSPNVNVTQIGSSTSQCAQAFSLLLNKGLIRVELAAPLSGGVTIDGQPDQTVAVGATDPFTQPPFTQGYIDSTHLSLFRRPLPSTHLVFLRSVMWDGRVAANLDRTLSTGPGSLHDALMQQANGATQGHAQFAAGLTPTQQQNIVDFETAFFTAQIFDNDVHELDAAGADGGPIHLADQTPTACGRATNPITPCFTVYEAWASLPGQGMQAIRRSIARGQAIFNETNQGKCTGCHTGVNAGNSESEPARFFNIGTSDVTFWEKNPAKLALLQQELGIGDITQLKALDGTSYQLPVYTLHLPSGLCGPVDYKTTDPGFFLIVPVLQSTGACQATNGNSRATGNLNAFKPPVLRGLAARAPYFHNGLANTLEDVVEYYTIVLGLELSPQDKQDLVAFLKTL